MESTSAMIPLVARLKKHTSYTLSDTAKAQLAAMSVEDGKSQTAFLEDVIRAMAKRRKLVIAPPSPAPRKRTH